MDSDFDLINVDSSPILINRSHTKPNSPASEVNEQAENPKEHCVPKYESPYSQELIEKQEWVKKIRLQFCRRKEFEITFRMIHDDGTINQDYFRPKLQELQQNHQEQLDQIELKKWTDSHKTKLCLGIQEFGIGKFKEISEKFLPDWTVNELRLKAMRLIGRQNLQLYRGWKGNSVAIAREYEFNKSVGLKFNTWKNSTLVYDDEGKVLEYLTRNSNTYFNLSGGSGPSMDRRFS